MYSINQIVNVTSFYFAKGATLKAYPRSIEFGNTSCTFQDGLKYLVQSGQDMVKLFDMTDGHKTYRLRQDGEQWTLIGTRAVA